MDAGRDSGVIRGPRTVAAREMLPARCCARTGPLSLGCSRGWRPPIRTSAGGRKGVGEGAVAPEDARPVEVDEDRGHRVKEPLAIWPWSQREAHEQAPVLDGVREVLGDQDGPIEIRILGQAHGENRREATGPETSQDIELGGRDSPRLFLERERLTVRDEEPDEMTRRADRQVAKGQRIRRLLSERAAPGQIEQSGSPVAQTQPRERRRRKPLGQSFFRR